MFSTLAISKNRLQKVADGIHCYFDGLRLKLPAVRCDHANALGNVFCDSDVGLYPLQIRHFCRTLFHNALPALSLECHGQAAFQAAKSAFYGKIWLDLKIGRTARADCKQSADPFFFPKLNGLSGLFHAQVAAFGNGDAS